MMTCWANIDIDTCILRLFYIDIVFFSDRRQHEAQTMRH